jgi:copper chaperone
MERIELGIDGMTCGGCVTSVERALERVPGVRTVRVSLERRSAVVEGEALDPALLAASVEDAGFDVRR